MPPNAMTPVQSLFTFYIYLIFSHNVISTHFHPSYRLNSLPSTIPRSQTPPKTQPPTLYEHSNCLWFPNSHPKYHATPTQKKNSTSHSLHTKHFEVSHTLSKLQNKLRLGARSRWHPRQWNCWSPSSLNPLTWHHTSVFSRISTFSLT